MNTLQKLRDGMISTVYIIMGFSLIVLAIVVMSHYPEIALAQATQSGEITDNQTTDIKINGTGNLTRQDLDPILNSLFDAREELLNEDSPSAFGSLNAAATQLFNITIMLGKGEGEEISEQLKPLQNRIERSRNVLLKNNNITAAILGLNAADTEFVKLTLKLQ